MITAVLSRPTLSTKAETHSQCSRMVTIFVTMAQRDLDLVRMDAAAIVRVVGGGRGVEDGYSSESGWGREGVVIGLFFLLCAFHSVY